MSVLGVRRAKAALSSGCIAYPVTTYRVVDLKANLKGKTEAIRADTPHLRIEVQAELMSIAEREQAATALRRVLDCLVKL
jgi:hypothetical protein